MKKIKVVSLNCDLKVLARGGRNDLCPGQPMAVAFPSEAKAKKKAASLGDEWVPYLCQKSGSWYVALKRNQFFLPPDPDGKRLFWHRTGFWYAVGKSLPEVARNMHADVLLVSSDWAKLRLECGVVAEFRW